MDRAWRGCVLQLPGESAEDHDADGEHLLQPGQVLQQELPRCL